MNSRYNGRDRRCYLALWFDSQPSGPGSSWSFLVDVDENREIGALKEQTSPREQCSPALWPIGNAPASRSGRHEAIRGALTPVGSGYVALLDVLGFSAMIAEDREGKQVATYLDCVRQAAGAGTVEFAVFSDSIILTVEEKPPTGLLTISEACAKLMFALVDKEIPVRGAISHGDFVRVQVGNQGIFVAGKAVIDAYRVEQDQDWIGVMIAASALRTVPSLEARCGNFVTAYPQRYLDALPHMRWLACIQRCFNIPLHAPSPLENPTLSGFAVVPNGDGAEPADIAKSLDATLARLDWLQSIAPTPGAQEKYQKTIRWLRPIRDLWNDLARSIPAWKEQKLI